MAIDSTAGVVNWTGGRSTARWTTPARSTSAASPTSSRRGDQPGRRNDLDRLGHLYINNGAAFNNLAGSTFDARADSTIAVNNGGSPAFNNAGTLKKSAGTGTAIYVALNNSGTIDVEVPSASMRGGAQTGSFTTAAATNLYLSGPDTFGSGAGSPAPAPPTSAAARPRSTWPWWPPTSCSRRRHADRRRRPDDHRPDGLDGGTLAGTGKTVIAAGGRP